MVRVTAVIPVFNQERYLGAAIDSVLAQTFRDFELVVVDDGSTDRTPAVIASYGERLRGIRQPNAGNAAALNAGIRAARGEWIGWLSSDDLWEPAKLERQMAALEGTSPQVGLVYADALIIDSEDRVIEKRSAPLPRTRRSILLRLARGCFINGSSVLIRRDVLDDVGVFDETDRIASDFDLWLRIAQRYELLHVPEALVRYRVHPGQISTKREAVERAQKRVASRALRRMGPFWGTFGAGLRIKDELSNLPWLIHGTGGRYAMSARVRAFGETLRILVNPAAL